MKVRYPFLITTLIIAFFNQTAIAEIIFQESFDSTAPWNEDGAYTNSECSVGDCAGTFPTGGADWNFYRSVWGSVDLRGPASIRQLPDSQSDHTTNTTSGKAFVGWDQAADGANFPGDAILGKYFGSSVNYTELYFRFFIRTQDGFQLSPGAQAKLFRTGHWRGTSNIFQWRAETTPTYFFDWVNSYDQARYLTAQRCERLPYLADGASSDYYCSERGESIPSYMTNDYSYQLGTGTFNEEMADATWHEVIMHIKMNDIGIANGVEELYWDGSLIYSHTDAVWLESTATPGTGLNMFAIGGNSNNEASPLGEWWYAIDDITVSTTPIGDSSTIRTIQILGVE